jgi:hypothetical protein
MRSTRLRRRRSPRPFGRGRATATASNPVTCINPTPSPRWRAWNGGKRVSELGHDRSLFVRRLFATTFRGLPVRNRTDLRFVQSRLRERIDENQIIDHMFD